MRDADEARLIEKLGKIEALFARAASDGERAAAGSAIDRIRERLREVEKREKATEFRFSLGDAWSKRLFLALLRRYGIEPYRYRGQRRTTVVARVAPSFCREVLWPEFEQLNATLRDHLESVTKRVVAEAIHRNVSEPEERPERERDGPIALLGGE